MELGDVRKVVLAEFTVIGKEGKGLAEDGGSWVPPLWDLANEHFEELTAVIPEEALTEINLWGLMSDEESWLAPWRKTGRYLAGIQVPADIKPPKDWQQWKIPEMEYLAVKTNAENLNDMTEKILTEIFPKNDYELAAAIQEHYLPDFEEGEVELFFPIKR